MQCETTKYIFALSINTKTFTPTADMISAAKAVFMAMAYTGTVREVIEPIQFRLLQENNYKNDLTRFARNEEDILYMKQRHGEYCRTWDDLWLLFDEDMSDLMIKAHYEYTQVLKFKVPEVGYCPLLMAESLERDAKRLLIETMHPVTGLSPDDILCGRNALENYKKLVELSLRLLAPYCKTMETV